MYTTLQRQSFLLLLGLVSLAFAWILIPFYGAVLWAVILAIVFRPLQRRLERRFGAGSNIAAAISVIVCIVLAVIPMIIVVGSVVSEGAAFVARIQDGNIPVPSSLADVVDHLPTWAQNWVDRIGIVDFDRLRERLVETVSTISQFLAAQALSVGQNTVRFIAAIGVMLYVLFFLFRDGKRIGATIRESLPLSPEYNEALLKKFAAVVRATVKGNIIIAIIQGGIGGVAFWALGIQGALLWGVLMMFLSMLPAVGAALVWAPVAGYLMMTGDYLRGGIMVAIGIGVIGLVDNLLRPPLVGKESRLPDYVVLVSTLGGLSVFGINGFVLGPLVAALFMSCWALFREEQAAVREARMNQEPVEPIDAAEVIGVTPAGEGELVDAVVAELGDEVAVVVLPSGAAPAR
ncbi:AI-2E family transporter [Amaricoccus sp.]|uniref:AI-2E family transporter n=1 Tax=Amaricoccus sp. TaxID=1872485 RepID=UPI001B47D6E4|nr:AI-2E family transporter [Amaricoccus sp.]MBP7001750.1 AI-2E family transporter [Amaricoccus sp.]